MVLPTPICREVKKPLDETADRLRQLADDCEERARRTNGEARNLFHLAAREARNRAGARHLGDIERREALEAIKGFALFVRWLDGEAVPEIGPLRLPELVQPAPVPQSALPPIVGTLRNARQLGEAFGMSERGARKAIERGLRRNLAGFYRHGAKLLAEPEAFAQVRR